MAHVQTSGATLFLTETGAPGGPAILFSNSLGTTHRMWDEVVALLAADFRCIRYDTADTADRRMTGVPSPSRISPTMPSPCSTISDSGQCISQDCRWAA